MLDVWLKTHSLKPPCYETLKSKQTHWKKTGGQAVMRRMNECYDNQKHKLI
ncbi:hypothetical protein CWI38_0264p0010 [Hamiltosporidium tvaerminnensis]|uniref:Uncharacterized protein n=1 Tax=Hamiltosporidium tvaerminnensis TaxID=1176355 RepID=A0A4Q9M1F0_9MICR|nr:hypothetical protein CWI38_0264p0010 [Hamiltosporidium tvaerminnensis]